MKYTIDAYPLISVLMPTYNRAHYIRQALESVLAQDYRPLEIIVVDDGSTDNTNKIVNEYNVDIVHYFYQKNSGIPKARNFCLTQANGDFISWIDSDDRYLSGKLTAQMEYMQCNPECDIVFSRFRYFIEDIDSPDMLFYNGFFPKQQSNIYHLGASLAKKYIYEKIGFFSEKLALHSDLDILMRMKFELGIDISHCIDLFYYEMRMHDNRTTVDINNTIKPTREIIFKNIRQSLRKFH
jgi:glycosyltransferase involved in cell wall biosynthesis